MAPETAFIDEMAEIVEMGPVVGLHLREEVARVDVDERVGGAIDITAERAGTIRVCFRVEGGEGGPNRILRILLGLVRTR